jgi:hypothetical protein
MFALRNKARALKNYISSFTEVSRPTINAWNISDKKKVMESFVNV